MPDPITHSSWSPYVSMGDNPIALVDKMGLVEGDPECGPGEPPPTTPDINSDPVLTGATKGVSGGGGSGTTSGGGSGGDNPAGINAAYTAVNNPNNQAGTTNDNSFKQTITTTTNTNGTIKTVETTVTSGGSSTTTTTMQLTYNTSTNSSIDIQVNPGIDGVGHKIVSQYSPPPTLLITKVKITQVPQAKPVVEDKGGGDESVAIAVVPIAGNTEKELGTLEKVGLFLDAIDNTILKGFEKGFEAAAELVPEATIYLKGARLAGSVSATFAFLSAGIIALDIAFNGFQISHIFEISGLALSVIVPEFGAIWFVANIAWMGTHGGQTISESLGKAVERAALKQIGE